MAAAADRYRDLAKAGAVMTAAPDIPVPWADDYEERAAILEFDGGLPRQQAQNQAHQEIIERIQGNRQE